MEARAGVPRGQAHRTGLCVRVCLRARHRPLSIALHDGSQAAPGPGLSAHQLFRCLRGGFQLCSLERRAGDAELSARSVEAYGTEIWAGSSAVPVQTSVLGGPPTPSLSRFGHLCVSLRSACLLRSGSLWATLPRFRCPLRSVTASSPFLLAAPHFHLESTVAPWPR